jgi:hypothetical protein
VQRQPRPGRTARASAITVLYSREGAGEGCDKDSSTFVRLVVKVPKEKRGLSSGAI